MKDNLRAWFVGFLFALGLGLSGMVDTRKIIGFLDITGAWDPSLLFVMGGAIGVHFFSYRWIRRRKKPVYADQWKVPQNSKVPPSLIVGSLLFGAGWGLVGYCPGPAVVALASLQSRPFEFVIAMISGMFAFKLLNRKLRFRR